MFSTSPKSPRDSPIETLTETELLHPSSRAQPPPSPPRIPPPTPTMGFWEGMYRLVMRRNGVYVTFVVAGAFAGERLVDYGVGKVWEMKNVGKRYQDIPVLGQRPVEE